MIFNKNMMAKKEVKTAVYIYGKGKYFIVSKNSFSIIYIHLYNNLL